MGLLCFFRLVLLVWSRFWNSSA